MAEETPEASLTLDIKMTHRTTGESVPVALKLTFPDDHGLYALQAAAKFPDYLPSLLVEMAEDGDASCAEAARELGADLEEDDEWS